MSSSIKRDGILKNNQPKLGSEYKNLKKIEVKNISLISKFQNFKISKLQVLSSKKFFNYSLYPKKKNSKYHLKIYISR